MGIEIQGMPFGIQPGDTATFTFKEEVKAFTLGLAGFSLTYGPTVNYWVQDFSIRMFPSQPAPVGVTGNVVAVQVQAELQDSSGHSLNVADSVLYPACIAMTGTSNPLTVMTIVDSIANGTSAPVSLGQSSYSVATSFLAGFALDYPSTNYQVLGANAGCGLTYNQAQGLIASNAALLDGSGHQAATATVDAGVIASSESAPGFAVQQVTNQTADPVYVTFASLTSISSAVVLLQSWQVNYPSVHWVQAFTAGSLGAPAIVGNQVVLPNLQATIKDNSGHSQNNGTSSATVLVIALP